MHRELSFVHHSGLILSNYRTNDEPQLYLQHSSVGVSSLAWLASLHLNRSTKVHSLGDASLCGICSAVTLS